MQHESLATRISLNGTSYQETWSSLLSQLYQQDIFHIFIEGGSTVFSSALAVEIVDRYHAFMSPSVMNDSEAMPVLKGPSKAALSSIHQPISRTVTDLGTDIWINCQYFSTDQYLEVLYAQ